MTIEYRADKEDTQRRSAVNVNICRPQCKTMLPLCLWRSTLDTFPIYDIIKKPQIGWAEIIN